MSYSTDYEIPVTATQIQSELFQDIARFHTKSEQIRYMHNTLGMSRMAIHKSLTAYYGKEVRYQHVRNVLVTPVKKA